MDIYTLQRELTVPCGIEAAFDFFGHAENLERITPPWLRFRILTPSPLMKPGAIIEYDLRIRGVRIRWLTEIERWNPPHEFIDVQLKGPYKVWRHTHRFFEVEAGTRIQDAVEYALPLGLLGRLVHRCQVSRDLSKIFDYRATRVRALLG